VKLIWQPEQGLEKRAVVQVISPPFPAVVNGEATYLVGLGASSSSSVPLLFLLLLSDASSLLWNPPAARPRLDLFFAIALSPAAVKGRLLTRSWPRWSLSSVISWSSDRPIQAKLYAFAPAEAPSARFSFNRVSNQKPHYRNDGSSASSSGILMWHEKKG